MDWLSDTSAGDWLIARLDDPWRGTMHDVVPRGFEAYARIFHPGSVQEIPGERMPSLDAWREMDWSKHEPLMARIVDRTVAWAETAVAFGTTFHPLAQWGALTTSVDDRGGQREAPDGRWFTPPAEGQLPPELLPVISGHLVAHTSTPNEGYASLWEGDGALLGHMGESPSRMFFQFGDPSDPVLSAHNEMLGTATRDRFNNVFRKESWQEGILSREISEGPRFEIPGRHQVLFRADVAALAAPEWFLNVPWRDLPAESHGFDPSALSPSYLWPGDQAWVVVTEVDYDSTIVGGSAARGEAICEDPRLEALPIPEGASLGWDSDEVNP